MRYTLIVLLLAGCAIQVRPDAGKSFTLEHGTKRFSDAMAAAGKHCAQMGLQAKHLGTDRPGNKALSRFECV